MKNFLKLCFLIVLLVFSFYKPKNVNAELTCTGSGSYVRTTYFCDFGKCVARTDTYTKQCGDKPAAPRCDPVSNCGYCQTFDQYCVAHEPSVNECNIGPDGGSLDHCGSSGAFWQTNGCSCVESPTSCPNGICDAGETCSTCPGDCGTCITCGNGSCDNGETCSTCPGDCGDCVNCISAKGHAELPKDCNKTGFYGRSYAILRDPNRTLPIGETYSCNPYPELIGNGEACGYWSNKWTGYLTIPETGDYEFWITYNPQLILQMDVDGNGAFDTACSNASQDPKAGDNYIFTSASCDTRFRYPYLNSWQIVSGALGGDCWDDYANRIPCEAGRHCEVADLRTEAVSTYPTILTPVPKSERGTTECPVSAVNSGFNNDWAREKGNMDTFFKRSLTAGQVKLNISYTSRVGDELNNQILQFRYRKVSTPALPWVKLWKPASYPNGVCPVTPCQMCMLTAPTSLNFTDQSPTSATLNWTLPTFMGTSQRLLVGSDQSKVNANCPDGTGSGTGCIADVTLGTTATSYAVSGLAPGEIYYWRLVNYKDNDCWRDAVLTMRSGNPSAWWQVKDADVMSDVGLTVKLPDGGYFNLPGPGGYPGVVIYGGTGLVNGNLTGSNVSEKGWIANSSTFKGRPFNSTYFLKNIPTAAKVTNLNLDNPIRIDDLATGGTAYNGYYYYMFNNIDENGDVKVPGRVLTIEPGGTATSLGDRKVILFVKGAGLNIDTNINLNKGKGFFLAVSTGDINISSEVGGGAIPNLEGVYVADGKINIGGKSTPPDLPLWVRGTMVGYSGVGFGRDLNDGNSGTPAELFEYAPDQELLFPVELASHPKFWQEVAP